MPSASKTLRPSPANVVRTLGAMLRERGIERIYGAACAVLGVLSVNADLTVWTNGRMLLWHVNGMPDVHPAADIEGATERLAALATRTGSSDTWVLGDACREHLPPPTVSETIAVLSRRPREDREHQLGKSCRGDSAPARPSPR
jgi:hypothetical protein